MSRALRATYRLQMHGGFRLADAAAIVPYLHRLGISHAYTSPVLAARAGSTHGYDVVDPSRLNPELGSEEDRGRFVDALHERGMGWLLDIVPNHMAASTENPYWVDVLMHGRASRWARWFDIDWQGHSGELRGRVLLPVLGARLAETLARHELTLAWEDGRVVVRYWENRFPVDPATVTWALSLGLDDAIAAAQGEALDALHALERVLARLAALPSRAATRRSGTEQRASRAEALLAELSARVQRTPAARAQAEAWLAELSALVQRAPAARAQVERSLERFPSGEIGPARMQRFLARQAYALVFWRRAAKEINYRRFFNINELVALSMEDAPVFRETHALVLAWIAEGTLDGVRIDHIDGLRDPLGYLRLLRAELDRRHHGAGGSTPRPPILVEKILSEGEHLRREWPVEGTTGYEVLNDLEAVLIEPEGFAAIEREYRAMLRLDARGIDFEQIARESKRKVLRGSLSADVQRLVRLFGGIARRDARTAAIRSPVLERALIETIVGLPVYRTYVDRRDPPSTEEDAALVDRALAHARADARTSSAVLALLREVLLLEGVERLDEQEQHERRRFVSRFQQTTGPAAAKGVEDTALYLYHPLASRNEVGSEPSRPLDAAPEVLHRANRERLSDWPRALVTTSTHDTKRGADTRARLDVLSEIPDEWWRLVGAWQRRHGALRRQVGRRTAPDANTEYLLYQMILGIWPVRAASGQSLPSSEELEEVRTRTRAYMQKAVREGKSRSGWVDQDPEFEAALDGFVDGLLDPQRSAESLREFGMLAERVAWPGWWNALARTLLHLTVPGVPDIYQGDELWSHTLVDPDNRRPVDYSKRDALLRELERRFGEADGAGRSALLGELLESAADGRVKLFLIWRALELRRQREALFERGSYEVVRADGSAARHVVAFMRRQADDIGRPGAVLVAVPRFTVSLSDGRPPLGESVWGDTRLLLPPGIPAAGWRCALSGRQVEPMDERSNSGTGRLRMGTLLAEFPVALLSYDGSLPPGPPGADVG